MHAMHVYLGPEGHLSIALIWVTIGADLVGSGALEDAVQIVRVAD